MSKYPPQNLLYTLGAAFQNIALPAAATAPPNTPTALVATPSQVEAATLTTIAPLIKPYTPNPFSPNLNLPPSEILLNPVSTNFTNSKMSSESSNVTTTPFTKPYAPTPPNLTTSATLPNSAPLSSADSEMSFDSPAVSSTLAAAYSFFPQPASTAPYQVDPTTIVAPFAKPYVPNAFFPAPQIPVTSFGPSPSTPPPPPPPLIPPPPPFKLPPAQPFVWGTSSNTNNPPHQN